MFNLERLKVKLKEAGLSYRKAAPQLGVTYQYLSDVLNGKRASIRLTKRIATLLKEGRN